MVTRWNLSNQIMISIFLTRVMHQPINAVVTNFIASRKEGEADAEEGTDIKDVKVGPDDIELPDRRNNKVIVSDDTKLEEMTQITCKIDNKVGHRSLTLKH